MLARVSSSVIHPMKMPTCPKCLAAVDIRPLYDAVNYRGVIPKGHGIRCRSCKLVLKVSQWKFFAVIALPLLLFIPFIWIEESSKLVRLVVSAIFIVLFLGPMARFFPQLYELRRSEPFEEIQLHES